MSSPSDLQRLVEYLEKGLITREEFDQEKQQLLSGSAPDLSGSTRVATPADAYPTEFEDQTPSNPALAACQAHLPMLLTQPGRSSIQPLHRPLAALYMQPGAHAGSCA